MKSNTPLIVVGVMFLATVGVIFWLLNRYGYDLPLLDILLMSAAVVKLCLMLAIVGGVAGLVGGLARNAPLLKIGVGTALLFGFLGGFYSEAMTQAALSAIGGTLFFEITVPSRIEALLSVAVGLFAALPALFVHRLRSPGVRT